MTPDLIIHFVESEADWAEVQRIRTSVFIEEQACPPEEEWDEHDAPEVRFSTCRHFLGEVDGEAVATARWHPYEFEGSPAAKLERFAVIREARGAGYGKAMITHLMVDARDLGFSHQILHSQVYLEKLYAEFGFVRVGDVFDEAGIPHVKMVSTKEP